MAPLLARCSFQGAGVEGRSHILQLWLLHKNDSSSYWMHQKITSPPKVFGMISPAPPSNLLLEPEPKPTPNRPLTLLVKDRRLKGPIRLSKGSLYCVILKKKELTENKWPRKPTRLNRRARERRWAFISETLPLAGIISEGLSNCIQHMVISYSLRS